MARRPIIVDGERIASAPPPVTKSLVEAKQDAFDRSIRERPKKTNRRAYDGSKFRTRYKEALEMEKSGEWELATAQHLVALYAILHERVYGIKPLELNDATRTKAVIMAARSLKEHFGGDSTLMATFMSDTWTDEQKTERWRRENKRDGGRLDWYKQFAGALATKWLMNQKRMGKLS